MNRNISIFWILMIVLIFSLKGISQNNQFQLSSGDNWVPQFNTYQELTNGKMHNNQVTLYVEKYSGTALNDWKITVKLQDDFINVLNSTHSIGAEHGRLSFSQESSQGGGSVNPSNIPVSLSKFNEVDLIKSTVSFPANQFIQRVFTFNLFIAGGTHLLTKPNGEYRANYEFKLYGRQNAGQPYSLIATTFSGARSGLAINYSGNYEGQNIILQNTANVLNFVFSEPNDYTNGKSITILNGLKVTSYNTHQITVKSSNSDFTSPTTSGTIPVSVLRVEASLNNATNNVTLQGPLVMSTTDQTLIRRTATWPQTLEYNLRFFIPPNQIQNPVEQGNYTAYIYFTIVPN